MDYEVPTEGGREGGREGGCVCVCVIKFDIVIKYYIRLSQYQ